MILLIDNYDSFVYNLARNVGELGFQRQVIRNDAVTLATVIDLAPTHILISPGPGVPDQAGISLPIITHLGSSIPILGVCLGHQAVGQAYGAKIIRAAKPMHGKSSVIKHNGQSLFKNLKNPLRVGRYHSLIVEKENLPAELKILAEDDQGEIMALQHQSYPVYGVQFHPESVLTEQGLALIKNFLML